MTALYAYVEFEFWHSQTRTVYQITLSVFLCFMGQASAPQIVYVVMSSMIGEIRDDPYSLIPT